MLKAMMHRLSQALLGSEPKIGPGKFGNPDFIAGGA
jgi:hypothetical protein